MRLIDLTRQSMGWNNPFQTRTMNQITTLGIHHSATTNGSQMIFENHWRNLGWRNGGYHEIVLLNGDVEICYVPTVVVNGVGDHNTISYHIAVVGNFRPGGEQPSDIQMISLRERIQFNLARFNLPIERVWGHHEFPNTPRFNHSTNSCPGQNMNHLRNSLRTPKTVTPPISTLPPVTSDENIFIVKHPTGGFMTAADAANTRNQRTTVQPGTYHVFRRANGMINVTRTPGVPGSWINPTTQKNTTVTPTDILVDSTVRVNDTARRWATGENIPAWVRGRTYHVKQLRNNSRELLLSDVTSWIHRDDVTLV
ncbi:MAG: N-acetylmuramoyl-L-alanine amidase [Defluviitaleaceae bacterium]|nr:N-acetylmuramoyl-L-alanine amidase [Defluviitaleaceae bacterium]